MKETLSVTFLNQPKLSEHKTDREINEKRISLVPQIEKFLLNHEMFKGKQIKVSFFHTGASSLVSLLETSEGRCVLKILLRANAPKGEALFLRKWESIGISVPHVYGTGTIKNHSYLLMKYIPGQLLGEHTETDLLDRGVFHQMGGTLRHMHTVIAKGYGSVVDELQGQCDQLEEWFSESPQLSNQFSYVKDQALLPDEIYGSIEQALETLVTYSKLHPDSTYCHWDFAPWNILDTNPITVFDPVSNINIPYLDLGRSIIKTVAAGFIKSEVINQLIEGYFSGHENFLDEGVLYASMLFAAYTVFPDLHRKGFFEKMENLKGCLSLYKN